MPPRSRGPPEVRADTISLSAHGAPITAALVPLRT